MTTTRLFIAAWPDEATRAVLRALPRTDEGGVRWVPSENWHITLRFLGDADPDEVSRRLGGATLPVATAVLGPAIRWLGSQLIVPAAGVDALATAVADATADLGEPPRHQFQGHLTVARTRRGTHHSNLTGHPVEATFAIEKIALVRSELLPTGARYTTVATFPTR